MAANRRTGSGALTPGSKGTFSGTNGVTLTFERDKNGQVIAFYAGNGRTRDVRFARVR